MFGHEAQVYVREEDAIVDPYDYTLLGRNTSIDFSFTTGTFIIVPPGAKGIRDRPGGISHIILDLILLK